MDKKTDISKRKVYRNKKKKKAAKKSNKSADSGLRGILDSGFQLLSPFPYEKSQGLIGYLASDNFYVLLFLVILAVFIYMYFYVLI